MNNFGLLCFCLALGLYAGKEFIDWFWWYYWNDDEDEESGAIPLQDVDGLEMARGRALLALVESLVAGSAAPNGDLGAFLLT